MAATLTTIDAVLKEFYEGAIRETVNNEVVAFKTLDESDREYTGRSVIWPFHTARNSGVAARAEGGTLPAAGAQSYLASKVSATYFYGRLQVSGQTIEASKGQGAFAGALDSEMTGLKNDMVVELGRMAWGTGDGRLCQVAADAASSTAVTVFNRYAAPGQPGARFLRANQIVDIGDVADPDSDGGSQTIISVALSQDAATTTDTVTLSNSALDISGSDSFFFVAGAGGAGLEMQGIQSLVDVYTQANIWGSNAFYGSAIQGMNRAANASVDAQVMGNGKVARILDPNLLQDAMDRIHIETGEEADFMWGHHSVLRALFDNLAQDRRYSTAGGPMKMDGGHSGLSYQGVPLIRDRQAPYNSLLVGVRSALKMYTLAPLQWASRDGSILNRIASQDNWEAFMFMYKQLGLDEDPKKLLMIRDIQTDF